MAEKKKEKLKIIREIEPELKEIKEEIEDEATETEERAEESLETEIQPQEDFEFVRFAPLTTTPTSVTTQTTENLEQQLQNVPSTSTTTTEQISYEKSVYNLPEYSYEKEVTPARREMQKAGFIVRPEEIRETKPRAEIGDWHELARQEGRRMREETVIEAEQLDRKTKLPFEEIRKYRRKVA